MAFSRGRGVRTSPNPQAGGPSLVGYPRLLILFIHSYPPYWRPFLHPQPEDALRLFENRMLREEDRLRVFGNRVLREEHRLRVFGNRVLREEHRLRVLDNRVLREEHRLR